NAVPRPGESSPRVAGAGVSQSRRTFMLAGTYSYRVRWGDCDAAGIVYYPNFYRWFDVGTQELVRQAGYPVPSMRATGHDMPLVETGCVYRQPAYYDDVV